MPHPPRLKRSNAAWNYASMFSSRYAQAVRDFALHLSNKPWNSIAKKSALTGLHVVNAVCAAHLFAEHVGSLCHVDGPSMLPTMSISGEVVLEARMIDRSKLSRGDLVTFVSPLDPTRIACKRIVGLPGDVVCVDPAGELAPSTEHVVIPKNHVWLSGDNAAVSRDSRVYGPVSMALIRGRLVARVWPISNFTVFRNNSNYID